MTGRGTSGSSRTRWSGRSSSQDAAAPESYRDAVTRFERVYLRDVLDRAASNVAEAAKLAGMDRSNFRRLLKRHHLLRD